MPDEKDRPENTPEQEKDPSPKSERREKNLRRVFSIAFPACIAVLAISLWQIFSIQREYQDAIDEYNMLREAIQPASQQAASLSPPTAYAVSDSRVEEPAVEYDLDTVKALNSDCVGWIDIPGLLSYPVVRGADNDKYLDRTFLGNTNSAGALFMDYRNDAAFTSRHTVIYGHNLKNGAMFGSLPQYTSGSFMRENDTIVISTGSAELQYTIFAVRVTDMYDAGYRIDFADDADFAAFAAAYGAPSGTQSILTLSTCTNVTDEERLLVLAALVG